MKPLLNRVALFLPAYILLARCFPLGPHGLEAWGMVIVALGPPLLIAAAVYGICWRVRPLYIAPFGMVMLMSLATWIASCFIIGSSRAAWLQGLWFPVLIVGATAAGALLIVYLYGKEPLDYQADLHTPSIEE